MKARAITTLGILTAVALILGYLEHLLAPSPVPGVKLGLANTVLLYALYLLDTKSAALLTALKVLLSGLLFSGAFAMLYALAGGVASLAVMLPVRRIRGVSVMGVSVCGAAAHNLGQLLVACAVAETRAVLSLLPLLLICAAVAGVVTGAVAQAVFRLLKPPRAPGGDSAASCAQAKIDESNTTEVSQ